MRVDPNQSAYHEAGDATQEFDRAELRRCRQLLRRLRFLESQVRARGGLSDPEGNGGAAFAEMEMEALEWVLSEVGFLDEDRVNKANK